MGHGANKVVGNRAIPPGKAQSAFTRDALTAAQARAKKARERRKRKRRSKA